MNFILIFGPPAVGKMTVGKQLADKLGYKLFHNHQSIDLTLNIFDYGDEGFGAINEGIRELVFKTVAESKNLKGFIFTLVWAFDEKDDWEYVEKLKRKFKDANWKFYLVELYAPQNIRLQRNKSPYRLEQKASKRNLENSDKSLIKMDLKYVLNSDGETIKEPNYIRIDNSEKSPEEVANFISEQFSLK